MLGYRSIAGRCVNGPNRLRQTPVCLGGGVESHSDKRIQVSGLSFLCLSSIWAARCSLCDASAFLPALRNRAA